MAGSGTRFQSLPSLPPMKPLKALRALAALGLAVFYVCAASQIAFPVKAWLEARAASPVKAEAFACALHKCHCRNALQCRTHCCCFPKASAGHSHHDDGLDVRLSACGGADEHGLMPPLPVHAPAVPEVAPIAAVSGISPRPPLARPASPYPGAPFKVPISSQA